MIVSHEHRYVFVKTRKTAGTSVAIALAEHTGPRDVLTQFALKEDNELRKTRGHDAQNQAVPLNRYGITEWRTLILERRRAVFRSHMPATAIRRLIGQRAWNDYLTFTVVRNPWEVAASAYAWQMRDDAHPMPFREFLIERPRTWSNWHLYSDETGVIVDELIRYERLEEDLARIVQQLDLSDVRLPKAKGGFRRRPHREMYGDEERQIVAEVCRPEIEHFGFEF